MWKRKLALLNFLADVAQALFNLPAFVSRQQTGFGQHLGVGDRSGDVVRVKPAIEAHAFGELLDQRVGRLVNTPDHALSATAASEPGETIASQNLQQHIYSKRLTN